MDTPTSASAEGHDAASPGGRDLSVAIAVGVVLAGVFFGSLVWAPAAFTALVGVLVVVAVLEGSRAFARAGRPVAVPVVLVACLLMLIGAHTRGEAGQVLGLLVLLLGTVAWHLADPRRRDVVVRGGTTALMGLWVGLPASYAALLVTRPAEGRLAVAAVIGGAVVGDIGAYAVGTIVGRRRIAPSISPHKTWEGLAGGIVVTVVLATGVLPQLGALFDPGLAAVVGALVAVSGFFGDLTESMLKRDLGVKDLGAVLPEHGGVLDRVDGILFALPVGYLAIELLA